MREQASNRLRRENARLFRIAKWFGGNLDRLPYDVGTTLRKTRVVGAINQWIADRTKPLSPVDPMGSAPVCVLPWMHLQVETTGEVQPCCLAKSPHSFGNVHSESILEIFSSGPMNQIRREMLRRTWPAECGMCRDREAIGATSFRQSSNASFPALFETLVREDPPAPLIRSLDLRINNVCNFKCRFCHGLASNRWFSEHNLVYPDAPVSEKFHGLDGIQSFWDDFDRIVPNLESIHIAGGEPLIIDAHYQLLEKLISKGKTDVKLQYDTNLSRLKFKHWDVIELWKKFPHLEVSLSLDGVGAKGEYIREGLDYAKWVENVRRLQREAPHARRNLHFVVCIFNVLDFPEHFRTIVENRFVEPGWMTLTFLTWPAYLSAQVLIPELKKKAERNLADLLSSGFEIMPETRRQIEGLIAFLKAEDLSGTYGIDFAQRTAILDQARGQNAAELFPELAPMLAARSTPLAVLR